jgi:hypothetical protein
MSPAQAALIDAVGDVIAEARRLRKGGFTEATRAELGGYAGRRFAEGGLPIEAAVNYGLRILRMVEAEAQA